MTVIDINKQLAEKWKRDSVAECRSCRLILRGHAYMYGGSAYHPDTSERCKVNKYGGFVCSDICDARATYDLETSLPGNIMGRPRP